MICDHSLAAAGCANQELSKIPECLDCAAFPSPPKGGIHLTEKAADTGEHSPGIPKALPGRRDPFLVPAWSTPLLDLSVTSRMS